jgi:hemoglobin-like flavoprotein
MENTQDFGGADKHEGEQKKVLASAVARWATYLRVLVGLASGPVWHTVL